MRFLFFIPLLLFADKSKVFDPMPEVCWIIEDDKQYSCSCDFIINGVVMTFAVDCKILDENKDKIRILGNGVDL